MRPEAAVGAEREQRGGQGREAISTSRLVMRMFQLKIGMRHMVMPGARIVMVVVMKLTAPRMVPKPPSARPKTHRSPPRPGL